MARRRSSRRFTRGKREYVWTAAVIDEVVSTGVGGGAVAVSGADWFASAANGRREATLLRIRGWLTSAQVSSLSTFASVTNWMGYIAKFTSDETAVLPNQVAAYTDENILWTGGHSVKSYLDDTNGQSEWMTGRQDIDVKAKRRISTDDAISLVYTIDSSAGSQDVHTVGVLRALIALG